MQSTKTQVLVKQLVPAVAVWAIEKALDEPRLKKRLQNARENKTWLAAGVAACAIGLGMIARAAKR